jgi:predicted ATPase
VEALLAHSTTATVLATSREGLGLPGEQLWTVPSLDFDAGADSAAGALFVERSRSVKPGFTLTESGDAEAVGEICRRVDGIALAIELAAARMVSMSPQDVCERLGDRFRLLTGSRRGRERQQTLRNTVQWSYELLDDDERLVLGRCSVFAGGFDLAAVGHLCIDRLDEYAVLDRLDSLVRKSLITVERVGAHARYDMLETIRQFSEEQLTATGSIDAIRDRHARYFADQALLYWDLWDGPRQRVALDWVDVEYANLRAGFRRAVDHGDVEIAATIAAHTTMLGWVLLRYEAVGWATEILATATTADIAQLPRLYSAASVCSQTGQPDVAIGYANTAVALAGDPRYDPFESAWATDMVSTAALYAGQLDQALEISATLVGQPGAGHALHLTEMLLLLPVVGRVSEARALADEAVTAARAHGNPFLMIGSLSGYGRAFADTNPTGALDALRQAQALAQEHRNVLWEAIIPREAAGLEAVHGDPHQALALFETAIGALHRAGDVGNLAVAFADMAVLFDRIESPEIAATLYGISRRHGDIGWVAHLPAVLDHLRATLGDTNFEQCVAAGGAMELADAVTYAQCQIGFADASRT